jgi:hypothetical protein
MTVPSHFRVLEALVQKWVDILKIRPSWLHVRAVALWTWSWVSVESVRSLVSSPLRWWGLPRKSALIKSATSSMRLKGRLQGTSHCLNTPPSPSSLGRQLSPSESLCLAYGHLGASLVFVETFNANLSLEMSLWGQRMVWVSCAWSAQDVGGDHVG